MKGDRGTGGSRGAGRRRFHPEAEGLEARRVLSAGDGLPEVAFAIDNNWGSGFQGRVTITNDEARTFEDWTLAFDLPHAIRDIWGAQVVSHQGGRYTVADAGWNETIAPGTRSASGSSPTPLVPPAGRQTSPSPTTPCASPAEHGAGRRRVPRRQRLGQRLHRRGRALEPGDNAVAQLGARVRLPVPDQQPLERPDRLARRKPLRDPRRGLERHDPRRRLGELRLQRLAGPRGRRDALRVRPQRGAALRVVAAADALAGRRLDRGAG